MRNKVLAAQEEDSARRLVQLALSREGFTPIEPEDQERLAAEASGRLVVLTYRLTMTGSDSTAPAQTVTMAAKPEELLRYTGGLNMDRVEFGRLVICYRARSVSVDGRELCLTVKEFELLAYMAYHKNLALTRSQLLAAVWEVDYSGDIRTVDCHIKCLRQKLGEYSRCIVTVRGVGYMFRWDDTLIG